MPLEAGELRDRVTQELTSLNAWIPPERLAGQLFGRLVQVGNNDWTPEFSHLLAGNPGVRVSSHSMTEYVVSSIPASRPGWFQAFQIPSPTRTRSSLSFFSTPSDSDVSDAVVFQTMLGEIVFTLPDGLRDVRPLIREQMTSRHSDRHPSIMAGAVLLSLAEGSTHNRPLSIDLSPPALSEKTVWVRHLSGGTYVYAEGASPQADQWEIVGPGFLDSRFERQLLTQ